MTDADALVARAPRFPSHALIDVRFSRWNPFSKVSAVLMDMSVSGFKLQFVDHVNTASGAGCQLSIPLEPFGIQVTPRLIVKGEIKWFEPEAMRAGGVFVGARDQDRLLIERVIAAVISKDHGF
jgi:hypothetical protein